MEISEAQGKRKEQKELSSRMGRGSQRMKTTLPWFVVVGKMEQAWAEALEVLVVLVESVGPVILEVLEALVALVVLGVLVVLVVPEVSVV